MTAKSTHKRLKSAILLTSACLVLSACVSDTLSVQNTQPQPQPVSLQTSEPTRYDPVQRAQAIEEMRAKAEQSGSGELTNAFTDVEGATDPLTPEQRDAKIRELSNSASENSGSVTDEEVTAKQESIRRLQAKGASHYKNAVNSIEN